ncbi:sensor histidine kinase [Nonomuraea sp. NPDC050536]|uniref:sensor histidine kinase n=1 Tax=Nonomuraea sp. NPDC050536 TaxID=3364366 RepID=UPI0037CBF339
MTRLDLAALRNPGFRVLGLSQVVSVAGDQVLTVAATIAVLDSGGDATALGVVLACRGVGLVLFLLVGGVWGDRVPRRGVLVVAYLVQAAGVGVLVVAPRVWVLGAVIFLAGVLEAFIRPAFNAVLGAVLREDERVSGRALVSIAIRTAIIAGPGLRTADAGADRGDEAMVSRGTALEAIARRPADFLRSAWPWRSLAYLLASVVPGVCAVAAGMLGAATIVVVGIVAGALAVPLMGRFERWRLRLVDDRAVAASGTRELGLGALALLVLWWIDLVLVGFAIGGPVVLMLSPVVQPDPGPGAAGSVMGVLLLPVAVYTITAWAGARGVVTRSILAPRDSELEEVLRSRARLVDAYELERRRIERDLHDGAQQRLVALSMKLGMARLDLPDQELVAEAQEEARLALTELRELIRGVHSRVLTDRGLPAAIRDLAGRSAVPVDVEVAIPERPSQEVEVAAYYVVSEALANVAKHSGATKAEIIGHVAKGWLVLEVRDDGRGGAVPGGGLTGLADRVSVVDGRLSLSSPTGGPTLLRVEIPCA